VNLLGRNIDTVKKIAEMLIDIIKEAGVEIKARKSKYTVVAVSSTELRAKS
jgi:hypothetical protein